MKEMEYCVKRHIEVLDEGECRGYHYVIVSYGTHPCAYVKIPKGHPYYGKFYDDVNLDVHGGLTYSGNIGHVEKGSRSFYLGWDYAHAYDYYGGYEKEFQHINDGCKKWTTLEIFDHVTKVINQIIEIEWKGC